jgi:CDP-diglyceride synthetase
MLSNWIVFNLLVSPGPGAHPYGESLALLFFGLGIAFLLILGLVFALIEPLLFLIRKKGKKVALVSMFLNGITLTFALIFLMIMNNGLMTNMFIYLIILLIQFVKYLWIKDMNPQSKKISKVYTVIVSLLYLILVII